MRKEITMMRTLLKVDLQGRRNLGKLGNKLFVI